MSAVFRFLACVLLAAGGSACNSLLKKGPAELSRFIEFRPGLERQREGSGPFHYAWRSTSPTAWQRHQSRTGIWIAPVETRLLRPPGKTMAKMEAGALNVPVQETAEILRKEFITAFASSPAPRYRPAARPGKNTVQLELALTELTPTSPAGQVSMMAADIVIPGARFLAGPVAGGHIAIEGKLRNSVTGELLYQFADQEGDQVTIVSLRDFQRIGHARLAAAAWARQFEHLTRAGPGEEIEDTGWFRLNPF